MSDYPEHDKLADICLQSQTVGKFVEEFLPIQGIYLRTAGGGVVSIGRLQELLAEFFGIDLNKIDAEKAAMLAAVRAAS